MSTVHSEDTARPIVPEMQDHFWTRLTRRESALAWLFLAPGLLILIVFMAYPFGYGVYISMTDAMVGFAGTSFIWYDNYFGRVVLELVRGTAGDLDVVEVVQQVEVAFSLLGAKHNPEWGHLFVFLLKYDSRVETARCGQTANPLARSMPGPIYVRCHAGPRAFARGPA